MLKTRLEIINWLDRYNIQYCTINEDLTVDVEGDVNLSKKGLNFIPVQFGRVSGNFDCSDNDSDKGLFPSGNETGMGLGDLQLTPTHLFYS